MFRPIYPPRTRAREYGDLAVTIYMGCPHGCTYCYAPAVLRKKPTAFHAQALPRPGIVEAVQKQLASSSWQGKKIMLCFMCDPYPIGCDTSATREVIRAIKESGNHVQILTKGDEAAQRDFDLLDSNDSFGVTWSGADFVGHAEPNAAHHKTRHQNIVIAKEVYGLHTWLSCEPVLDPVSVYAAIQTFDCVDMFRIGKLNHRKSEIDWAAFGHKAEALCLEYGRNYYIKEDLRKAMEVNNG